MFLLRHSLRLPALLAAALTSTLVACNSKVIVDGSNTPGDGGGGAGGTGGAGGVATTSVTTTSVTSGVTVSSTAATGGPDECTSLEQDLVAKVAAAQACDPTISSLQCSGAVIVNDLCGCEVAANEKTPAAAQSANLAFKTWVGAGCGPFACLICPPPPPSPWYCDPTSLVCKPAFEK